MRNTPGGEGYDNSLSVGPCPCPFNDSLPIGLFRSNSGDSLIGIFRSRPYRLRMAKKGKTQYII